MQHIENMHIADIADMWHSHPMAPDSMFPVKKLVGLTGDIARQITDFRYDRRLPSDNEAIRRLIEGGLNAEASTGQTPQAHAKVQRNAPAALDGARPYPAKPIAAMPADSRKALNVDLPVRLKAQLNWLAEVQPGTLRDLVEDLLQRGVDERLDRLGVKR